MTVTGYSRTTSWTSARVLARVASGVAILAGVAGCVRPSTDVRSMGACRDGLRVAAVRNDYRQTIDVFLQPRASAVPLFLGTLDPGTGAEFALPPAESWLFGRAVHASGPEKRLYVRAAFDCR